MKLIDLVSNHPFITTFGFVAVLVLFLFARHKWQESTRSMEQLDQDSQAFPELFGFDYPAPEYVNSTQNTVAAKLKELATSAYNTEQVHDQAVYGTDGNAAIKAYNDFTAANQAFEAARDLAARTGYSVNHSFRDYVKSANT